MIQDIGTVYICVNCIALHFQSNSFYDPCLTQIEKMLVKFGPKFFELYASI